MAQRSALRKRKRSHSSVPHRGTVYKLFPDKIPYPSRPYYLQLSKRDTSSITNMRSHVFRRAYVNVRSVSRPSLSLSHFLFLKDSRLRSSRPRSVLGDDRRFWLPSPRRDRLYLDGNPVEYTLTKPLPNVSRETLRDRTRDRLSFADPVNAVVCIRRRRRRHALFSSGNAGSGISNYGPHRWNEDSKVKC